jgi:glyoxylase I family protein
LEPGLSTSNKKITADKQSIKMEHIPKIKGLTPYIEVFDMPLSLKFYRDVLGFSIIMSSGKGDDVNWVLLQLENAQLMLNTAYEKDDRPKEPDPTRIIGHQDITFYFNCSDIDGLYKYLLGKDVEIQKEPHITGYGWKAMNIKDPDSYGVCFHTNENK